MRPSSVTTSYSDMLCTKKSGLRALTMTWRGSWGGWGQPRGCIAGQGACPAHAEAESALGCALQTGQAAAGMPTMSNRSRQVWPWGRKQS